LDDSLRPRFAANRLLTLLRERVTASSAPATLVDQLASELGLAVSHFNAQSHPGTLGYLEPGEPLIFLQQGLPEPLRRFTLAHEIGHAVLHRSGGRAAALAGTAQESTLSPGEWQDDCDIVDLAALADLSDLADETLQAGQAYSARARRESEANAFAAALLLPAAPVFARYLGSSRSNARSTTRELAEAFGVSEDVVLRRLTALLLERDQVEEPVERVSAAMHEPAARLLDAGQRVAVESSVPALIVAGPGTGKTSALLARIAHLIEEMQVAPTHILALTFSRRAATELRERLEGLLVEQGEAATAAPLALPTMPVVSTFHAFCGDLLRRYGDLVGLRPDFRLVTETEGYFLLRQVTRNLDLRHYQPLTAPALYFPDMLQAISRAKDELVGPQDYTELARTLADAAATNEAREHAEKALEIAAVYEAYQHALQERGDPDFGDVIRLTVQLLREHPDVLEDIRAEFPQILVDEFQDINRAMGVLLRTLAGEAGALWAVGDPDQAIYRFRGASPANLARFTEEYPSAGVHYLTQNYRSGAPIVEAAVAFARGVIGELNRPALVAARGDVPVGKVTLAAAPDEAGELAGIARAIEARVAAGRSYGEQAVLCRTRRQVRRIAEALEQRGVPVRLVAPLLEQPEIKDVLAVLALLVDSNGAGLLRAGNLSGHRFSREEALAVLAAARARGIAPVDMVLYNVNAVEGLSREGERELHRLGEILVELRAAPDTATGLTRYIFALTALGHELLDGLAREDEEAGLRAMHLARLVSLARAFEDQRLTRNGMASWAEFLDYVRVLLTMRHGGMGDDLLATARDGVWILTVHASKGLEFPVVYLPGLANSRFPSTRQRESVPLLPGLRDRGKNEDTDEHLTEEACLFYVAMTRARDELILSHAQRYGRRTYKVSPFLGPVERALGVRLAREAWSSEGEGRKAFVATQDDAPSLPKAEDYANALSASAVETYLRCPRQYAYRYVYQLEPREAHLLTMRRQVVETLRELSERLLPGEQVPTAEDARTSFEQRWSDAQAAHESAQSQAPAEAAFGDVYRRYGALLVQRSWLHLLANRQPEEDEGEASSRRSGVETVFDKASSVSIGRHTVTVTVDRVEQAATTAGESGAGRRERAADARALRLVRHQLSRGAKADARELLYVLAAEQQTGPRQADVLRHNLATGEQEPVKLTERQVERLRGEIIDALEGIERGEFPARPDAHTCQGCPYLLICPA
jgi:superfamily I DNA/RNA helicase/Zn-dependent peptidase ImmA (M78 family)/CRISPR/Cas system-associated exonuclease Cas4 (RecB family)